MGLERAQCLSRGYFNHNLLTVRAYQLLAAQVLSAHSPVRYHAA